MHIEKILAGFDLRPFWGPDRPNRVERFAAWVTAILALVAGLIAVATYVAMAASQLSSGQVPETLRAVNIASTVLMGCLASAYMCVGSVLTYTLHDFLKKR